MVGGFLLNVILTAALHPSGEEDDHPAIFTEYADSSSWIAVHLGQFIGVLVTLSGLLVLYRVLRSADQSWSLDSRPRQRWRPPQSGLFCRGWTEWD